MATHPRGDYLGPRGDTPLLTHFVDSLSRMIFPAGGFTKCVNRALFRPAVRSPPPYRLQIPMDELAIDPVCPVCDSPFRSSGCTATTAARFRPWDGADGCDDCGVETGNLHHPVCDRAICVETGVQGLSCTHCEDFYEVLLDAGES
jgi:hypothetical protein